jgi:mono/diheme cytochrome c family protein
MKVIAFTLFLAVVLLFATLAQAATGKELFDAKCAGCHSKDGSAETAVGKSLGAKDLRVTKLTDAQILTQLHDGKDNMPPFSSLTKEEADSVVAYVHELGKAAPPVKASKKKKKK